MSYDWGSLLNQLNAALIASTESRIGESERAAAWLGFPGASEEQIVALERRLGTALPGSYREFLAFTNGWRTTGPFIDRIWGTEDVEWFSVRNQEWIDAYQVPGEEPTPDDRYFVYGEGQDAAVTLRPQYLQTALEVSDVGDSAILLLNPQILFDGEWEAFFFANWHAGAVRYRSFWDLMVAEYESVRSLL